MTTLKQLRAQYPQYDGVSDGDFLMGLRQKFYPTVHPRAFFNAIKGAENAHVTIKRDDFWDAWKSEVVKPMDGETLSDAAKRSGGSLEGPAGDPGGRGVVAARSLLQGLTFGAGDEIVAAGKAALDGSQTYSQALKAERDRLELGRENNPVAAYGSEIVGALAVPGAVLQGAKAAPVSTAAKSAGVAGAEGTLYGFLSGEGGAGERAKNALTTAAIAAPLGAAAPSVGGILERGLNNRALRRGSRRAAKGAPSGEELRAMAGPIFQRADQVDVPTSELPNVVQGALDEIAPRGINPRLMPKTAAVADELTDLATQPRASIPYGDLSDIRRMTAAPRGDFTNPVEQRGGGILARAIDDFVSDVDPSLSKDIKAANEMWGRLRKNELIEEAIAKANLQASGFENGLRVQFRQILNNKRQRARFTPAERKAMEDIVKGTRMGNLLKRVGRLGFGRGQQTNVLSGTAGAAVFGPASIAAGQAAMLGSEKVTSRQATLLSDLVRAGGAPNVPLIETVQRGILDAAIRSGARTTEPLGLSGILPLQ